MKRDSNKIILDSFRNSVDSLIKILNKNISGATKESDKKARLKSKRNAFVSAKNIMQLIYSEELFSSKTVDMKWYRDKTEELCSGGESAILEMCDLIGSGVPEGELGGSEINANIDMRDDGAKDVSEINKGIKQLRENLKKADKNKGLFEEEDEYISLAEDRAVNK